MTAKKKVLKYLKAKNISQYEFSKKTGLANGYLNSGDNITSANLDLITDKYVDLNLTWLVKGIGPMIITPETKIAGYNIYDPNEVNNIINEDAIWPSSEDSNEKFENMSNKDWLQVNNLLKQLIQSKDETIQNQKETIAALEQLLIEKDDSGKLKDQLIAYLQQELTKE